jgi:hypothetical protein
MIKDKELIYLSVLLKMKMKSLGKTEQEIAQKHNLKIIRSFIETIKENRINQLIDKLKQELIERGEYIEKTKHIPNTK